MTVRVGPGLVALLAAAPAAAAAPILGEDAPACRAGNVPAIQVDVSGLRDRTGRLKLELYPASQDDFLKDDHDLRREGKVFRRVWAPMPPSGPVTMCIRPPAPGRYALLFTHDRDGRNKFDVWRDGAGVVGTARIGRSRPKLHQAVINVGNGVTPAAIRVQYMRGLSGFGPISGAK